MKRKMAPIAREGRSSRELKFDDCTYNTGCESVGKVSAKVIALEMDVLKTDDRYSRQVLFKGIGAEGQPKLASSRVVIVGCGATGSALASLLARSGVGTLRIIDRDYV
jgi:glutamyl-tRNA reductase